MQRTIVAAPALPRFVEAVTVLVAARGRAAHQRLPDGRTTVVFRVRDGGQSGDLCVAGPRTRAQFKDGTGVAQAIIVQLKPGWSAPLLGVPASALTDRVVPLAELWGGDDLCHQLLAAPDLPTALDRLSRAIATRAEQAFEPASARLARRAVRLLERGESRVEQVAAQLGVTARHLRRAFLDSVGVAPKDFARGVRLGRALRQAATSTDWARIAVDAGYYDQAHLIGDFRDLIGMTPGAYRARTATPAPAAGRPAAEPSG
jgi:AraC-like DNA-binding protein